MAPTEFYTERLQVHEQQVKALTRSLFTVSMVRLSVFFATLIAVYFLWGNTLPLVGSLIIGVAVFLYLVAHYTNLRAKRTYAKKIIEINEQELRGLQGDHSPFRKGERYIYEAHEFNQDIDLFGEGSIFQLINRTEIAKGEQLLAHWLNSNDIDAITTKQQSIQELAKKAEWHQHYKATAALIETNVDATTVAKWMHSYKAFVPKIMRFVPLVFSIMSIGVIAAYSLGFIAGSILLYWFLLGLAISGRFVKKITRLYNASNEMKETFAQYSQLLKAIEEETFEGEHLRNVQNRIKTDGVKASEILRHISKQIDYLGNRNNMIFAPVANGFFLWDLHFAYRIEAWLTEFDSSVHDWFEVIEYFDAMNSFANFAFNHPNYVYPTLKSKGEAGITADNIGHPLLKTESMVTNSIAIQHEDFFIITGANMAGKSTFLRTVAVSLVMANCGLPVCAKSFSYTPIKLISSMRSTDSLTNDESYFFSELKRLKFIVESIQQDTYFIILDEILKGTNSKDKAEGSQQFVERLVNSKSTGLIATHDLSLCQLADKFPTVHNYYFDAEIVNDELFFDYTFKTGICQNMNASFLLKKMGIV